MVQEEFHLSVSKKGPTDFAGRYIILNFGLNKKICNVLRSPSATKIFYRLAPIYLKIQVFLQLQTANKLVLLFSS